MTETYSLKKPIILWCLSSLFFAYQFILRLSIGVLREDIIQRFEIDTVAFGTLASYYYLGYAGMQIPLGIMLDKLSFRMVTFISILIACVGMVSFVTVTDWHYLLLSRLVIGAGSAVGFLSVAKVTKSYFPEKYHNFLLALSFTIGLTGAVLGVAPMQALVEHFGGEYTLKLVAAGGMLIASLMLAVDDRELRAQVMMEREAITSRVSITKLLTNPTILIIGLSGGLLVGSLEGFADVWAIPLFQQMYQMHNSESSVVTSCLYVGMCFGGPILALTADLCKSNSLIIILSAIFMSVIFLVFMHSNSLSSMEAGGLMFWLGIFCCYQVLVFTLTSNLAPRGSAALAIAIVNSINMTFGHFFHKVMSIFISINWDGKLNEIGMPLYSKSDFTAALIPVPLCCALGILGFWYVAAKNRHANEEAEPELALESQEVKSDKAATS